MERAAIISTVRQALDMPMLSEGKCLAVGVAVLEAVREPTSAVLIDGQKAFAESVHEAHIEGVSVDLLHKLAAAQIT